MIMHEMTFKFFNLHFLKKFVENVSEVFTKNTIENFLSVLWTEDNMIVAVPGGVGNGRGLHRIEKECGYEVKRVFLPRYCTTLFFLYMLYTVEPSTTPPLEVGV